MEDQGYLYGSDVRQHKDYSIAKSFLNKYVPDSKLSLGDSCYYLNNYNHLELRGGHKYARPSYSFKFLLKSNMKFFHKGEMEYCYHGTHPKFLVSILEKGLKVPDGITVKGRNGSEYGIGIYSTKIPQYAELYAEYEQYQGKYVQVILLLRQDLNYICTMGGIDKYGVATHRIYQTYPNLKHVHHLHKNLMKQTDIQWLTQKESSVLIEAIIVKVHDVQPRKGEAKKVNQLIGNLLK